MSSLFASGCGDSKELRWHPDSSRPVEAGHLHAVQLYVENTGSMDGYVKRGGKFSEAVYDYTSRLASLADTLGFSFINRTVIPQRRFDIDYFFKNLDVEAFRAAGGDRNSSDIAGMLSQIIRRTDSSTLSIFVSDCVLDPPSLEAAEDFGRSQVAIRNSLKSCMRETPDLGVVIIQLAGEFYGNHFYSKQQKVSLHGELRPYYIWLLGRKQMLASIVQREPLPSAERGYLNHVAYTGAVRIPYTVENMLGRSGDSCCECLLARETRSNPGTRYEVRLHMDLSPLLRSASSLLADSLYSTVQKGPVVTKVQRYSGRGPGYTHTVVLHIPQRDAKGAFQLCIAPEGLPDWVYDSTDELDDQGYGYVDRTAGLKYTIGAVAEAFGRPDGDTNVQFSINNK